MYLDQSLLGCLLVNRNDGSRCKIIACWLEEPAEKHYRPSFVALTVTKEGDCSKITLPSSDWDFDKNSFSWTRGV